MKWNETKDEPLIFIKIDFNHYLNHFFDNYGNWKLSIHPSVEDISFRISDTGPVELQNHKITNINHTFKKIKPAMKNYIIFFQKKKTKTNFNFIRQYLNKDYPINNNLFPHS